MTFEEMKAQYCGKNIRKKPKDEEHKLQVTMVECKHYFENQSSNELINTIVERENLNSRNSAYLSSRGKNGGTWMHPILFIDFAMWINPSFKYDVIKFVYDEMIRYRNEAGDAYRELSSAIMKIVPKDFMPKAMQKNWRSIELGCI